MKMTTALATAALTTMATRDSKRYCSGGHGNDSGGPHKSQKWIYKIKLLLYYNLIEHRNIYLICYFFYSII